MVKAYEGGMRPIRHRDVLKLRGYDGAWLTGGYSRGLAIAGRADLFSWLGRKPAAQRPTRRYALARRLPLAISGLSKNRYTSQAVSTEAE